jgi:hypothetical protein
MEPSMIVDGGRHQAPRDQLHLLASMKPSVIVDGGSWRMAGNGGVLFASMWPSMIVDGDTSGTHVPSQPSQLQCGRR